MNHEEDQQILDWIANPNTLEKGFKVLVEKYQQKLYWHVRRMVLNHDDADDVLQNTFIKVYKSIDHFEAKSSLYTWLYRIATNETLTFLDSPLFLRFGTLRNFFSSSKKATATSGLFAL